MFQDGDVGRDGGGHAPDLEVGQGPKGATDSHVPVPTPDHELADQIVVVLADLVTRLVAAVEPNAEAVRHPESVDPARTGQERPAGRVFGVDPHLDGVTGDGDVVLAEVQWFARGDPELLFDEVQPGHQLGHRMLDLEAGVHFEVVEGPVLVEELDRSGVGVAAAQRHGDGCLAHGCPHVVGKIGSRRLLNELLVAALGRAVTFAEVDGVAVGVGQYLNLDVTGGGQVPLHVDLVTGEVGQRLALG